MAALPAARLYIVSDFPGSDAPDDFVFPAISQQTWEFLSILLETPCESLFEIGTGSGAAALTASRYAKKVRAGDVSPRCLQFAEFNRRLNGVENLEVLESDVFAGVGDQTFDRIIAHPPYVPWTGRQDAYRHGGPDGEAVLRRLIEGLSDRLRPGGRLCAATMGLDTSDAPLEDRLREMLGGKRDEFDILLVEREILTPLEFVLPWVEGEGLTFEEAWSLSEVLLERKAGPGALLADYRPSRLDAEPRTIRRKRPDAAPMRSPSKRRSQVTVCRLAELGRAAQPQLRTSSGHSTTKGRPGFVRTSGSRCMRLGKHPVSTGSCNRETHDAL